MVVIRSEASMRTSITAQKDSHEPDFLKQQIHLPLGRAHKLGENEVKSFSFSENWISKKCSFIVFHVMGFKA